VSDHRSSLLATRKDTRYQTPFWLSHAFTMFALLSAALDVITEAYKISPTLDYFQPARSNTMSAAA
tara:strand:- start:27 stop:224 length:198 start_codon:yes stop_codon:yes gene_type:complete